MKKYILLILIPLAGLLLSSCDSTSNSTNPPSITTGSIFVQSTPPGAAIAVGGSASGKVTPDSVTNLDEGTYNVTLSLTNYKDTTFSASVTAGFQTVKSVTLTSDISTTTFGPIKIWETTNTTSAQPSGLDLSAGVAKSSSNADVDLIYYSDSNTFEIREASGKSTSFDAGASSNLFDGVSSSSALPGWATSIPDRDSTKYYFIFDNDLHYSKLKIVNYGGGTPTEAAWVQVQWIYNKVVNDKRFPTQP